MLLSLIRSGSIADAFVFVISSFFVIFLVLPVHEWAHAICAHWLGDDTAKWQGRLTINPIKHIDWLGAVAILLVGFGWAKPVPINPRNFKNPKWDSALVSFAGPISNLIMGTLALFFSHLVLFIGVKTGYVFSVGTTIRYLNDILGYFFAYAALFFQYVCAINFSLAVFNLIPIPPLDGSKILFAFLPERAYFKVMQYERYISMGLMLIIVLGMIYPPISLSRLIAIVVNALTGGLDTAFTALFGV